MSGNLLQGGPPGRLLAEDGGNHHHRLLLVRGPSQAMQAGRGQGLLDLGQGPGRQVNGLLFLVETRLDFLCLVPDKSQLGQKGPQLPGQVRGPDRFVHGPGPLKLDQQVLGPGRILVQQGGTIGRAQVVHQHGPAPPLGHEPLAHHVHDVDV